MQRHPLLLLIGLLALFVGAFWFATGPDPLPRGAMAGYEGDARRGEQVFWAGGCISCHAPPGTAGAARLKLAGGVRLNTDFGTFVTPNISPDKTHGIGAWTLQDFADAMLRGVNRQGHNLYPAFPYPSYNKMTLQDVADLWAYLGTLPAAATPSQPDEIAFPFSIRRLVGTWNRLFVSTAWVVTGDLSPAERRGRYLAEALAHCGQCHTPRNGLGAMQTEQWLGGAPNPDGKGRVPNITPAQLTWSEADIATYLRSGLTPTYDSAGGQMAEVVANLSHLPESDLQAIAAYIKTVKPVR